MPSEHELSSQLKACRRYLASSLGHIPEVRRLIADIDSTLEKDDEACLRGTAHSPAGVLMLELVIRGDQGFVFTGVQPEMVAASDLIAKLNEGITLTLHATRPGFHTGQ